MVDSERIDPCVWRYTSVIRPKGPQEVSLGQRQATLQVSTAATRFALKEQHRPALRNPFRVRVRTGYQPGAAFIRIRGFSCPRLRCASLSGSVAHHSHKSHKSHRPPRLICASLSGSIAALTSSINANTLNARVTEHSRPAKQWRSAYKECRFEIPASLPAEWIDFQDLS